MMLSVTWEVQAFAEQAASELLEAILFQVKELFFPQEERQQGQLSGVFK